MNATRKVSCLSLSAILLSSALIFSCKDDPEPAKCTGGSLEMKMNGEPVEAQSFNNTLIKGNDSGTDGKRLDIRATLPEVGELIITATDLTTGTSNDGIFVGEYTSVEDVFDEGTENVFFFNIVWDDISEPFVEGALTITSCDAAKKTVSGTFSFGHGEFQVTEGVFTDVCYKVIK